MADLDLIEVLAADVRTMSPEVQGLGAELAEWQAFLTGSLAGWADVDDQGIVIVDAVRLPLEPGGPGAVLVRVDGERVWQTTSAPPAGLRDIARMVETRKADRAEDGRLVPVDLSAVNLPALLGGTPVGAIEITASVLAPSSGLTVRTRAVIQVYDRPRQAFLAQVDETMSDHAPGWTRQSPDRGE